LAEIKEFMEAFAPVKILEGDISMGESKEVSFTVKAMKLTDKRVALMDIGQTWYSTFDQNLVQYAKENISEGDQVDAKFFVNAKGFSNLTELTKSVDINEDVREETPTVSVSEPTKGVTRPTPSKVDGVQAYIIAQNSKTSGVEQVKLEAPYVGFTGKSIEDVQKFFDLRIEECSEKFYNWVLSKGE